MQSEVIDLAEESFRAFSSDISTMFGVSMECRQAETVTEEISTVKKRFKRLVAVNSVKAEGTLNGTFYLVFDQEALFTLTGIIIMLPERRILENRKQGDEQIAKEQADAVGETGNLLVGSWDRIFREGIEGHKHFTQSSSFIGNPWLNPKDKIGLDKTEQVLLAVYEIAIEPYSPFKCGVMFPLKLFEEQDSTTPENSEDGQPEKTPQPAEAEKSTETQSADNADESKTQPQQAQQTTHQQTAPPDDAQQTSEQPQKSGDDTQPQSENVEESKNTATTENTDTKTETADKPPEQENPQKPEPEQNAGKNRKNNQQEQKTDMPAAQQQNDTDEKQQPVSKAIRDMTNVAKQSIPDKSSLIAELNAKNVMRTNIAWAPPDETVQQINSRMQQQNVAYVLIGTQGVPEGIISKSDVAGALSPYLRNIFSKWRRPLDDATLRIKAKWIMSRPVRTVTTETSMLVIMESMRRFGLRAMPVINQQGEVEGIVTVFDIFKALTENNTDTFTVGKDANTAPPLQENV